MTPREDGDRRDAVISVKVSRIAKEFWNALQSSRETDLAAGKVNRAELVDRWIRDLMEKDPRGVDLVLQSDVKKYRELQAQEHAIVQKFRRLTGMSSIDEWEKARASQQEDEAKAAGEQYRARQEAQGKVIEESRRMYARRHENGKRYTQDQEVEWARGILEKRGRLLKGVLSPEQFLAEVQRRPT